MAVNQNAEVLDIEKMYEKFTTAENIKESFDRMTAPSGTYLILINKKEMMVGNMDHPFEALRGREYVHVFGKMSQTQPDGTDKKFGSIGFDASWEKRLDRRGNPDQAYKMWGQIVRALKMEDASIGETFNALDQYPLTIKVRESFKTPEGNRVAWTKEARSEYRGKGYSAKNYVDRVQPA